MTLKRIDLARPAWSMSFLGSAVSVSTPSKFGWGVHTLLCLDFYLGSGDPNLGLHVCLAGTLLAATSLHSQCPTSDTHVLFFFFMSSLNVV